MSEKRLIVILHDNSVTGFDGKCTAGTTGTLFDGNLKIRLNGKVVAEFYNWLYWRYTEEA